jgi:vitamin B12 transporter
MFFYLFLFFSLYGLQAATYTLPEIKVTAPKEGVKSANETILTEQNLAQHQQTTGVEALQSVPSVNVIQSGSQGRLASLFIRGGNSDQVLVLLDGMPLNNPSTPNGSFDFSRLTVDGQTVVVKRGLQSAACGAGAMAGVVDVSTAEGRGPASYSLETELGTFHEHKNKVTARGDVKDFNFSLAASDMGAQSPPTTPVAHRTVAREWGGEKSGRQSLSSRTGYVMTPKLKVNMWNRYQKFETHYPDIYHESNPSFMDEGYLCLNRIQLQGQHGAWHPTVSAGYVEQENRSRNDQAPYLDDDRNVGKTVKLEQTNTLNVSQFYDVHVDVVQIQESYSSFKQLLFQEKAQGHTNEIAMGHTVKPLQNVKVEGWVRHHQPNSFSQDTSYQVSTTVDYSKTTYHVAYGKGIKAPSLRQVFDPRSGNKSLKSETNHGFEVGAQRTLVQSVKAGVAYFSNVFDRMIDSQMLGPNQFTYVNIQKARIYGTETFMEWKPNQWVFRLDHTFLHAKDTTTNTQLKGRPMHKVGFQADHNITEHWSAGAGVIVFGKQVYTNRYEPYNRVYLGTVPIARVFTRYQVNSHCQWFGRVENALNRRYEMPAGYLQPGFSVLTGIKIMS